MKNRDFDPLDPLPADWPDSLSEYISTGAFQFLLRVKPGSPAILQVPAAANNGQVGIGIEGRWRYISASVERVSPGGGARTLDVFVTASDNSFAPGSPGEIDSTDYSFALAIVEHNATPVGPALSRLVATAVWDATQFTALDVVVGAQAGTARHAATHAPGGSDPLSGLLGGNSAVVTAQAVLDVGVSSQVRAGRQLALADFTTLLGLVAPVGLWNLTTVADISGNARNLVNKGVVPFGAGITGATPEAALFTGLTSQALYIADTGGADPFRIKTGSWGCWFRSGKRATTQVLVSKYTAAQAAWFLAVDGATAPNKLSTFVSNDATGTAGATLYGATDVCDDRWHFAVVTHDGNTLRLYCDGVLEASAAAGFPAFGASSPLNVGAAGADGSTAAIAPHFGAIDEAFVTADVLSEAQVRVLYAAKIAHSLGGVPRTVDLAVRRRRRGGLLATTDFPATPRKLYNFTAGSMTDAGSDNDPLVATGSTIVNIAGPDGTRDGAIAVTPAAAGLAGGVSFATLGVGALGAWVATTDTDGVIVMIKGASGVTRTLRVTAGALVYTDGTTTVTGPVINDGAWHFVAVVFDIAAGVAPRIRVYLDGRLIGTVDTAAVFINTGIIVASDGLGDSLIARYGAAFQYIGTLLTAADIAKLYAVGSQALPPSPKDAGAHVEAVDAASLYVVNDTLEPQHQIDLTVAA